ncbi:hypothetical protein, partial [Apilactobacillus quenuiae]|uniref:hypothetical protein n=1 Tax=Apilactobacillus quenuiae TaxID=2008377 RepID=UPI0012FFE436
MQYNKKQFKKINDKKIMKKVKKNWVVLSVSSLAILGGFTVSGTLSMNKFSNYAKADVNTTLSASAKTDEVQNNSSNDAAKTDEVRKDSSNDAAKTDEVRNNSSNDAAKTDEVRKDSSNDAAKTDEVRNNSSNDAAKTDEVRKDSSNDTTNKSSVLPLNKDKLKQVISSNSKLETMLGVNLQSNSNIQQKQADEGAIKAWNTIHSDDSQSEDDSIDTNTDAYKAGYKGLVDAWNNYNELNSKRGTQATKNYANKAYAPSDGAKTDYNNPHSVDSNLNNGNSNFDGTNKAQILNDPNASQNQTSDELHNMVDSSKNGFHNSTNNYNENITFDDKNDVTINDDNEFYYNQGITDFLKYQGAYDAETGRWNDNNQNDAYTPDESSANAYDQAYRGAQDAISQQFNNDDKLNYDVTKIDSFNPTNHNDVNTAYTQGFNDVKNQVNYNKIAYVANSNQLLNSISTRLAGYYSGDIQKINFLNNMNLVDVPKIIYSTPSNLDLSFNGQNHIVDAYNSSYEFYPASKSTQITIENFSELYGTNYYGPVHLTNLSNAGNINYKNVTYVGPQLVNATYASVNVYGNLNVFSVGSYNSPWNGKVSTLGSIYDGDSQQNMEISQLTMHNGSNYYGSTTGGNAIQLSNNGKLLVSNNAHMKIVPKSMNFAPEDPAPISIKPSGIYIMSGTLEIDKGGLVEINPTTSTSTGLAKGIYDDGSVNIQGGELDINDNGSLPINDDANYIGSNMNITNNGWLKINGSNMNGTQSTYKDDLLSVGGKLMVTNDGNMAIHTDGTGNDDLVLIDNSGTFHVDNPGEKVQLQIDNINGNPGKGRLFTKQINAYYTRYAIGYQNNQDNIPNTPELVPYSKVMVPASGKISYRGLDGEEKQSNDDTTGIKYFSFNSNPRAVFKGNIDAQDQRNGEHQLTGSIILKNLPSNAGLGDNGKIAINVTVDDNPNIVAKPVSMKIDNDDIHPDNGTGTNGYVINIPSNAKNNDVINFVYDLSDTPKKSVDVTTNYFNGIQEQKLTTDGNNYISQTPGSDKNISNNPEDKLNPSVNNLLTTQDAINDGIKDGINDSSIKETKKDNYSKYQQNKSLSKTYINNYNDAYDGYQQGINDLINTNSENQSYNPSQYDTKSDAYKNGYKQSNDDYQKGFKDKLDNKTKQDSLNNVSYKDGSDVASGVQNTINGVSDNSNNEQLNGHNEFNAGFKAGMNNLNKNKSANYDPAYNYGIQVASGIQKHDDSNQDAKDIYNGIQDALQKNNPSSQSSAGYNTAYEATINGMKNQSTDGFNAPQSYANEIGKAAFKGISDGASGNTTSMSDSIKNSTYSNAKAAFNAGFNDNNSDNKNLNPYAYQAGQDTKQGMDDAIAGKKADPTYSNNDNYNNAYQAAKDGFNGQIPSDLDKQERKAYNHGENVEVAVQAASQDIDNRKNSSDDNSAYKASLPSDPSDQQAYKEAYTAYKDGANKSNSDNPAAPEKTDDINNKQGLAYQAGTTHQATEDGVDDARNENDAHAKNYQNNDNNKSAYNNAKDAYQAGFNQQSDSSSIDNNQGGSYNFGRAAQAAIQDAASGKYSDDPESSNNDSQNHHRGIPSGSDDSAYSKNNAALPWTNPQKQ